MSPTEKLKRLRDDIRRHHQRQSEQHQRVEARRAAVVDWSKLPFEERMELREERRQTPEYIRERAERLEALKRRARYREIWAAIRESEERELRELGQRGLRISPATGKRPRPRASTF